MEVPLCWTIFCVDASKISLEVLFDMKSRNLMIQTCRLPFVRVVSGGQRGFYSLMYSSGVKKVGVKTLGPSKTSESSQPLVM